MTTPALQTLQRRAFSWVDLAQGLNIVDYPSYESAAFHLQAIKALRAEADEAFDPIIKKAFETHHEALAKKRHVTDPLVQAETILKSGMGVFDDEQTRLREEEERRRREEADRLAAELRQAEIQEAEATGASKEELQALAEAPLPVMPIVVAAPRRVNGVSSRTAWKDEVTDLQALVRFAAMNETAINGLARSLKSAMSIPGIRVTSESQISSRRQSS